jgi:nicotinamidase-related amidase
MTSALIIIDVQQALCSGQYAAFEIDAVIERINGISTKARAAAMPVIFVQHEEDEGPLPYGGAGWQLAATLTVQPDDLRVRKTTPDSFHQTNLHQLLRERGVDALLICGLQTDFCVDTTVRRAFTLGYSATLVADAHSTLDNGVLTAAQIIAHHNATLGNFGPQVKVALANELVVV